VADEVPGPEVGDVKKLRQLEEKNQRLKQLVAEPALDIQALKAITAKLVGPKAKRGLLHSTEASYDAPTSFVSTNHKARPSPEKHVSRTKRSSYQIL
jgi:hypothetical protein